MIASQYPLDVRQMVATARALNSGIEIVLRSLSKDGIGTVFLGEEYLAKSMMGHVLECFAPAG